MKLSLGEKLELISDLIRSYSGQLLMAKDLWVSFICKYPSQSKSIKGIGVFKELLKNLNIVRLKEYKTSFAYYLCSNHCERISYPRIETAIILGRPLQCFKCKNDDSRVLRVMFIDRNEKNVSKDNIEIVCLNCGFIRNLGTIQ